MRIVRARTFNLLGPGLPVELACGAFVQGLVKLERLDADPVLRTGNLTSARDFTDVRDAVRAYVMLAEHGRRGAVYNVCSGKAVTLAHCLDVLVARAERRIGTEVDPARVQTDDIPYQVGTYRRLHALTNWAPRISVEQSLADMLDHERRQVP
jgi:GDP-4-dehydro-6-deoxy-D-mannose reductase